MRYLLPLILLLLWPAVAQEASLRVMLTREVAEEYAPGQPLSVRVVLEAQGEGDLTALGLYETVPEDWSFLGAEGADGAAPAVMPPQGQGGVLQFGWVTPPRLPYQFVYLLQVPAEASGDQLLSGQAEFRLMGGRMTSAPVVTPVRGPSAEAPKILLKGANPMLLPLGTPYGEPGYTATDAKDGDLSASVRVEGAVDHQRTGRYTVTYSVEDADGNAATPMHRLVLVGEQQNEEKEQAKTGDGTGSAEGADSLPLVRPAREPRQPVGTLAGSTAEEARATRTQALREAQSRLTAGGGPVARKIPADREIIAQPSAGTELPPGYTADRFATAGISAPPLQVRRGQLEDPALAGGQSSVSAPAPVRASAPFPYAALGIAAGVSLVLGILALLLWRHAYSAPAWRRGQPPRGRG